MVTIQIFARPPYGIDDNVIHKSIKYLIREKQETKQHPFLLIAELIKWIKSKKLLDNTLELLANAGYFQYSEDFEIELQSNHFFNSVDEEAKTRIRAILYSELLVIEIIKRQFSAIDISNPPVLDCQISTESVITNSDEIFEYIREAVNKHTLATIKNLKPSEQESEYTRLMNNMASLQFENRSEFFKKDLENLTILKTSLVAESLDPIEYPFNKIGVKESFSKYTTNHIIDAYTDYSYLFQELKERELIKKMGHKEFVDWVRANNYDQSNKLEKAFIENGQLKSKRNCHSESRQHAFLNTFKGFL